MTLIQQQDDSTCGVACAAMVAGVTFEDALAKAGDIRKNGMGSREMGDLLRRLGVRYTRKMFAELNRTVPHIIVAPSLNVVGGLHYIVADLSNGFVEVHDPQHGRTGKKYYRTCYDHTDGVALTSYAEVIRIDGVRAKGAV